MASDNYKRVLQRADQFFAGVLSSQSDNLRCGRGCSLCCHGLFEIGSGDLPILAEGLESLHPARRRMVIRRAQEIIITSSHPNLRQSSPEEKAAFFERTASIPCPNLNGSGECMIYEHRPLLCRTFGLPVRLGDQYIGDVCELNFTEASQEDRESAAWDLEWEDVIGPEDEYSIPEAIVIIARARGW